MAVSLHTFTPLVLVNLGLPFFLKGSHSVYSVKLAFPTCRDRRAASIVQSITLFKGYSIIPSAPISFNWGIKSRALRS